MDAHIHTHIYIHMFLCIYKCQTKGKFDRDDGYLSLQQIWSGNPCLLHGLVKKLPSKKTRASLSVGSSSTLQLLRQLQSSLYLSSNLKSPKKKKKTCTHWIYLAEKVSILWSFRRGLVDLWWYLRRKESKRRNLGGKEGRKVQISLPYIPRKPPRASWPRIARSFDPGAPPTVSESACSGCFCSYFWGGRRMGFAWGICGLPWPWPSIKLQRETHRETQRDRERENWLCGFVGTTLIFSVISLLFMRGCYEPLSILTSLFSLIYTSSLLLFGKPNQSLCFF